MLKLKIHLKCVMKHEIQIHMKLNEEATTIYNYQFGKLCRDYVWIFALFHFNGISISVYTFNV